MQFLLALLTILNVHAEPISLLQENREIECDLPQAKGYDRVVIDRKDTKLTTFKGQTVVDEMERERFLDSALLVKKDERRILFHILPSGEITLIEGNVIPFKEADCEDTGASKICKNERLKKLTWSPEKLFLEGPTPAGGAIDAYGFLANHATYFRARGRSKPTLVLIDYGAPVDLVVGTEQKLSCHYR